MMNRIKTIASHLNPKRLSSHSKKMSTTVHNDNKACCTVPAVPSSYQPKGSIQKWGGFEQVGLIFQHRLKHHLCLAMLRSISLVQRRVTTPFSVCLIYSGQSHDYVPICYSHPWTKCHHESDSFKPQTQLGADILASCLNTRVFMPNFFFPDEPISLDNFPPQTDEQKQALQDFFGGTANPPKTVGKVDQAGEALKKDGYKKLVVYGLCWGRYYFS